MSSKTRFSLFSSLFSWLQSSLPQESNINELFNKYVRESKKKVTKKEMMKEFQEQQFNYFRNEFNIKVGIYPVQGQKEIAVNVHPEVLTSFKQIGECFDNYYIAQDLKQYRP